MCRKEVQVKCRLVLLSLSGGEEVRSCLPAHQRAGWMFATKLTDDSHIAVLQEYGMVCLCKISKNFQAVSRNHFTGMLESLCTVVTQLSDLRSNDGNLSGNKSEVL